MQNQLIAYLTLLRPKQWTKNLLVFAALIFGESFHDRQLVFRALIAFAAMCLASSAVYIINDIRDVERDRRHPRKKDRPIAAGKVTPASTGVIAIICLALGLGAAFWLNMNSLFVILIYLGLQVAYNLGIKHVAVADVFCIAVGFVLRAILGAAAIDVPISGWLLFCTGALALMLGFAKRRQEFIAVGDNGTRESLVHYTRVALDAFVAIFACGAAMCYGIYCLESQTAKKYPALILTSIFVFYGIARYVLIVFGWDEGGEPETLLYKDKHILISLIFFVATSLLALSGMELPLISN